MAKNSSNFYSDLRNASSLELTKYYCVNCRCSAVTMPIRSSSYATWNTSETVVSVVSCPALHARTPTEKVWCFECDFLSLTPSHLEFEMANELEERARNLLLIIVGYVTDRSRSQKQLAQFITRTYFAVG